MGKNLLSPYSASKSLEIKEKQERVSKANEALIFVNKLAAESGTWIQQRFLFWKLSENDWCENNILHFKIWFVNRDKKLRTQEKLVEIFFLRK